MDSEVVAIIREMLMVRKGEVITEKIADERARNIAAWLLAEAMSHVESRLTLQFERN